MRKIDYGDQAYASVSDTAGHYKIDQLDPGKYVLSADRNGFVLQAYLNRPGTTVTLAAGQKFSDGNFRLAPQGVNHGPHRG